MSTSIVAKPALYPRYDPEVSDYVTRCTGSEPVRVSVATDKDTAVEIEDQGPRRGRFEQAVALESGRAFSFATSGPRGERTHHVRCLPADFPTWSFDRSATPSQEWYVLAPLGAGPNYVIFFDRGGVPVWWYKSAPPANDAKLLSDGNLAFASYYGGEYATNPLVHYEVRRLDGSLVRSLATVGTVTGHHDLQEAANGNYLLLSYRPRDGVDLSAFGGPSDATVLDAEVQEITPAGNLVWSWNSKDHVTLSETGRWWPQVLASPGTLPGGRTAYDVVHINSLDGDDDDSLLISLRHTDAVYSIDRSSGAVQWKLGGTSRPESLTTVGDPNPGRPFGGQHDARRLPDGSVSLHDNGTGLNREPRGARYTIDTNAKTATLTESITDLQTLSSFCCGSARKLTNGNWLMNWGSTSIVTEIGSNNRRVFTLTLDGAFSYRADPVTAGRISRQALRDGMDAQARH